MKKYQINKAKKILLASLTIPVVVSSLAPIVFQSEEVHANTADIPVLRIYELNGSPKLEWATEILQENILAKTSFENGDLLPVLNYVNSNYEHLHSITEEGAFNGRYGYVLNDNSNGKGNYYNYPATSSDKNLTSYGSFYFQNGTPLSLTFKAKSIGTSIVNPWGNGNWANSVTILPNKFVKSVSPSDTKIYVDSVEGLHVGNFITNDTGYEIKVMNQITEVNHEEKSIKLVLPIGETYNIGDNLKTRGWRTVFDFNSREIENNDWQTYSTNAYVANHQDYDVAIRGTTFYLTTATNGKLMIDDITFGYATEVEVYRDGQSVYKGYLADFHDTTVRDTVKPNQVSSVKGSITDDLNVNLVITKPSDNGKVASYQIQSIAQNGNRNELSPAQEIEIKTDVVKYKYSITNETTGTPNLTTNSLQDISVPLKSINLETDYLHVQAIDENGNESDIESFKMKDILDTSNLQNLYDKLKELEGSNDYLDFIDFIDELEDLFGDNLPQDLKDRLQQLSEHHGVNTSFLLLEEGDFRLTTSDINDFGKVKLTAKKQTVTTGFDKDFGIIDARGTQEGWNVTVSATPFTVETFDGFIGKPNQLPVGSLALNVPTNVEQVGTVHNSQLPNITLDELSSIDGANQVIQLLNADKQKGMGEFKFNFGTDALSLTVDAVTAKIDKINYPDRNTPYVSTVTWNLITGPQL